MYYKNMIEGSIKMEKIRVREYADGTRITEDEFEEYDNSTPYYDDYKEFVINESELEDFLNGAAI